MIRFKSYIRGVLIAVLLCIGLPSVFALIACSKSVEQVKEICIFDLPQYSELKKNYGVEYEKWKSKCKDNYEFNFFKNMKVSFFPGGCSGRRKPMQSKLITESKKIDDVVVYIW